MTFLLENGIVPGTLIYREARAPDFPPPSFAYGYGSGFSSNIAGISQSSSIGTSFKIGDGEAYGAGSAGSGDTVSARGIGYAHTNPPQQYYRTNYPYSYIPYNGLRNSYGNAISSAQTIGNSAVSQTYNAPYGQSFRAAGYGSAIASSNGYGSTATSSSSGSGTAISSAQSRDALGSSDAVSASQVVGGVQASTAHIRQQLPGGQLSQAGATTINGRGYQASHSTVINADPGYY